MFRITFKNILRILWRERFHTIINILGLGTGLGCAILVLLYVQFETTVEKHHEKSDRIYMYGVGMTFDGNYSSQPTCNPIVGPLLQNEMSGIESFVRFVKVGGLNIEYEDKQIYEDQILLTDSTVFSIFTYDFILGDPGTALSAPYSIVITKSLSEKLFGNENPLGKTLELEEYGLFTVNGVIEDVRNNSLQDFEALLSYSTAYQLMPDNYVLSPRRLGGSMNNWTFFLFRKDFTPEQFYAQFQEFYDRELAEFDRIQYVPLLDQIEDAYLNSNIFPEFSKTIRVFLFVFSSLGIVILLLACINYINLSISSYSIRAKEIGIKKVIGSKRSSLIYNFMIESIIVTIISLYLAYSLVELIIDHTSFTTLIQKDLEFSLFSNLFLLSTSFALMVLVSLISGIYPAFYLTRIKSISAIKGDFGGGGNKSFVRNILVSFQLVISICVITVILLMNGQLNYVLGQDMGFDKHNVMIIRSQNEDIISKYDVFANQMESNPNIESVSLSSGYPGTNIFGWAFNWESAEGEMEMHAFRFLQVSANYFETMKIDLVDGRGFDEMSEFDKQNGIIVNESMVKFFNWDNAIGKKTDFDGEVIGVVKDFNFASLRRQIEPMFIILNRRDPSYMSIRINRNNVEAGTKFVLDQWNSEFPDTPINYTFLDDRIERLYDSDRQQKKLISYLSVVCVIIACMGLLGMISFDTARKTKEIAVRKVHGANVLNLIQILFKKTITLVFISGFIAFPMAYLLFTIWQNEFAYKSQIGPMIFIISLLGALFLACATAFYHILKVSYSNPVISLRYE